MRSLRQAQSAFLATTEVGMARLLATTERSGGEYHSGVSKGGKGGALGLEKLSCEAIASQDTMNTEDEDNYE
ncbi:MAG: hypothetical protein IKS49_04655 [Actinomycetaceae bacterium]|nr:hypothetical protein [Actinomycetaceae bacterium]